MPAKKIDLLIVFNCWFFFLFQYSILFNKTTHINDNNRTIYKENSERDVSVERSDVSLLIFIIIHLIQ